MGGVMAEPIAAPGVYDLPAADYHADPVAGGSLSSTGARKLLPPSCPAIFRAWVDGQREDGDRDVLDFGRAAHRRVLGVGDELEVIPYDDWRTKAAKEAKAKAVEAGRTPIKAADLEVVLAMVAALRAHPFASLLLSPERGKPEQVLVWRDSVTGVWCRAMVDNLPHLNVPGRVLLADYKTSTSAHPDAVGKAVNSYGYHAQMAWYREGMCQVLGVDPAAVAPLLVVQEKTPPYLVTVAQVDDYSLRVGAGMGARAREIYAACTSAGHHARVRNDGLGLGRADQHPRLNHVHRSAQA